MSADNSPPLSSPSPSPSPSSSGSNKRKGSEETTAQTTTTATNNNKSNKRIKPDAFSLESLKPFDFFITAPPLTYAHVYPLLTDWMESVVNGDFTAKKNPFSIPDLDKNSEYYFKWQDLLSVVNNDRKINDTWDKFAIVDKILALSPSESWDEKLEKYTKLQKEVWWVQTSNKWFKSRCLSYKEYLKTGAAAVLLELWYRFVWAKYTYAIHERIKAKEKLASQSGITSPSSSTTSTSTNDIRMDETEEDNADDIIDLNDLGAGHEEELEEEDDDDSDEGEHDVRERKKEPEEEDIAETDNEAETDDEAGDELMPGVVSLFFTHITITNAIDETEAAYFDNHPTWDISRTLAAFVQLVAMRNRDHKVANAPTMEEICEDLQRFYLKRFVPFLSSLGITTYGNEKYVWKWNEDAKTEILLQFVDQMYVTTFRNLTDDGSVSHSHEFFYLFPGISQLSDPRSVAVIPQIYTNIQTKLKNRGLYLPEVDTVVTSLDGALAERDNLTKNESGDAPKSTNPLIAQIEEMKRARIAELDALIEKLRDEYHKLTASVDQIQSTPVAKVESAVQNYEPSAECFASKLFQNAHTGDWVFVSFVTERASVRRIAGFDKNESSGNVENAKNLDSAEGCNYVLKIFATDSKFVGKTLFVFRADQLFGENARPYEEYRWVFDLVLDHPSRTKVAVVDWHNSISDTDLESLSLPLSLDSIKVSYNPRPQAKPCLHSAHPYASYSDFKWIFSQLSSSFPLSTNPTNAQPTHSLPMFHKLFFYNPQNLGHKRREISSHTLQLTNPSSNPSSSFFFIRGAKASLLAYWEPDSYLDNSSLEAAFRKYIAHSDPSLQQLSSMLMGTDKKGSKKLKAKLQQHKIWEHSSCFVVFESSLQFVVLASPQHLDTVRFYGIEACKVLPPSSSIPTTPGENGHSEQQISTVSEQENQLQAQLDSQPLQRFGQLEYTKQEPNQEGTVFKGELTLPQHQKFLYLVLGNSKLWDTCSQIGLPLLPPKPNLQGPPFRAPILGELFTGPISSSEFKNIVGKCGERWMDANCEKVMEYVLKQPNTSLDWSLLVDTNVIDELNMEESLETMFIGK